MLSLWLAWLVLIVPVVIAGYRMLLAAMPPDRIDLASDWNFVAIWLGLLGLANVLLLIATTGSLTPAKFAALLLATTSVGLAHSPTRTRIRELVQHAAGWRTAVATAGAVSLAAAFAAAMPVYLYDTGLYHYPHIKWLAEHGEVPGLALLHERFGLVSSWFTIPATLDHGIFAGRASSLLNGFAFAVLAVQIVLSAGRWWRGIDSNADRFLACAGGAAAAYALAVGFVNSASPDLPGFFLPAIIVWLTLRVDHDEVPTVALLLALLLVTVKLSALPVAAITGLFVVWRQPWGRWAKWGVTAAIIVIPMAIAGVVTSGCLLFPVAVTCLDVPWSLGTETVRDFAKVVIDWARWSGPTPAQADLAAWWAQWGARKSNLALALLFAVSIAAAWGLRRRILADARVAFAAMLAIVGLCYVIFLAPDLRFAIGYLVLLPGLFIAHGEKKARHWYQSGLTARAAAIAVLLAMVAAFVINIKNARQASFDGVPVSRPSILSSLIVPPRFIWLRVGAEKPDPATYVQETNAGFPYYRPVAGDWCWDIPLPCSSVRLPSNVALRKPEDGLAGGFVRR
jgi:hypothetical protein